MRRSLLAVQVAAFVAVLGVPDGALGVLWPALSRQFHRPLGDLGFVFLAGTALYAVGGLGFAAAPLLRRRNLLAWSCAFSAAAAAGWAASPAWAVVLVTVAMFGFGRGLLDAVANARAAGTIRALGVLHAGWAVGGALGPLLVAALAQVSSWRAAVAVIALAAAAVTVAAVVVDPAAARGVKPQPQRAAPTRVGGLVLVTVGFAVYTAAEAGPVAWGYVVLTAHRGLGTAAAAAAVAGFWVLLTLGRLGLGAVGHRLDQRGVLLASSALLAGSLALFWQAPAAVAAAALALSGLGSAAVFPVLVALTPRLVGAEAAQRGVGVAIAAGAVGGPLAVLAEGQLTNRYGPAVLPPALLVAALGFLAVAPLVTVAARRPALPPTGRR